MTLRAPPPLRARSGALALLAAFSAPAFADEPRFAVASAPPASDGVSRVLVIAGDDDVRARLASAEPTAVRADSPAGDATVRSVSPLGRAPVRTVIAVDQSGSFKPSWSAAFDLAESLADATGPTTTTEVITFGATLTSHGAAADKASLEGLLATARKQGPIQGYTRLRNFILEAVDRADTANPVASGGLRQVVVFTDAGEESTAYTVDQVVQRARQAGVLVHIVAWLPKGATSARRLDEVKQMAEGSGGAFIQTDDPDLAAAALRRIGAIADRAFWIDLGWCGVPAGQDSIDSTVEIEAWTATTRLATTGPRPFRQHATPTSTASCTPPAEPVKAEIERPAKWPWWWWIVPASLLPLLLLLLLLLSRRKQAPPPREAPPPPPAPPLEAPPPRPADGGSAFPPVLAGDDPLERLPVVLLERVKGPPEAPSQLRLHARSLRIGAAPEAELRLTVAQISSLHATVQLYPNGNVFLRDDGSTNGTFLGDRRLEAGQRERVKDGDLISFSRHVTYRVVRPGAARELPPPPPPEPPPPPAPTKHKTILAPARSPDEGDDR